MSFCVKCGEEGVETVDGLCIRCFLDGRKLVVMPHHVDLIRCANCNEFMVADQWVRKNQDDAIFRFPAKEFKGYEVIDLR